MLQLIANQPAVSQAIQPCGDYLVRQSALFVQHIQYWQTTDSLLYDIPLVEWLQTREYHPRQHLRIGDIANDMTAMKMTSLNINQLSQIYHHLGLRDFCIAQNDMELQIGTGHFCANGNDVPCVIYEDSSVLVRL